MIIATLIAADRLDESAVSAARDLIAARGIGCDGSWLEPGSAYDLRLESAEGIEQALRERLPGVDIVVQPAPRRTIRLMVADMDSTMIGVECIDELADYAGLKREVAEITERAMRGELDFEAALEARVSLLAGLDAAVIDRCREERVRPNPGAQTLVRTMRARGATCLLVSGGFTAFADPVAEQIGFDRAVANRLLVKDGRLTGAVARPIVGGATKREALLAAAAQIGIGAEAVMAVGDGANDIPMVEAAGLGIAYRAKPALAAAADARIEHQDLTALLYAQGITRSDWVVG